MSEHSSTLLLFGATGDLSRRMLLPSLYALHADELIDPALRIFGTARSAYSDAEFREFARTALCEFLPVARRTFFRCRAESSILAKSLLGPLRC